jgi:hypothetical protein
MQETTKRKEEREQQREQQREEMLQVLERFEEAENHGKNGDNWWNPESYRIAYKIKMKSWPSCKEMRKVLSPLQNEYYGDEVLNHLMDSERVDELRRFIFEMKDRYNKKISITIAGRSGGWMEVDYSSLAEYDRYTLECELEEGIIDEEEEEGIYNDIMDLEELENEVAGMIENTHREYNKYVGTTEYYEDVTSTLIGDDKIREIYEEKGREYLKKAWS